MATPDDSALLHGGVYDPAKAHEYYLRTRVLKGRPGSQLIVKSGPGRPRTVGVHQSPQHLSPHAKLEAQKEALQKRLEYLRRVLARKVAEAKHRSGVDPTQTPTQQAKEKSASNEAQKKDTPLTESQKKEKAKKAREQYKKENQGSLSQEVIQLQSQIKEIRAQIEAAVKNARAKATQPNSLDGAKRPLPLN